MAYSDFDLINVKKTFGLTEKNLPLFNSLEEIPMSDWLTKTLARSQQIGFFSESEKARSEFIVAPVLVEVQHSRKDLALYSGKNLDVDKSKGLNGECDFILSKGGMTRTLQAPIVSLVEAKKNDIDLGLGQCVSQMVGAQLFNQQEGQPIDTIFGCVTSGDVWLFLKLHGNTIAINAEQYYLNSIGKVLGAFKQIVEFYD